MVLCKEMDCRLRNDRPIQPTETPFLEHLAKNNSIPALLGFDQEGKKHFQKSGEIHRDDEFDVRER